jgi:protein-S-isoprenylcysteine O-methyltransferase Ste14
LVGLAAQLLTPIAFTSLVPLAEMYLAGLLLCAIGGVLAGSALRIFQRERTTTVPGETSAKLVMWGPYRFSRNPMYLGLFIFFVGVSMLSNSLWSVPPLLAVVLFLNFTVIVGEERKLGARFGEDYVQYAKRVRRWI